MSAECRAIIAGRIRTRGPMTVAEYMDLALYNPECGYYARASRRTGRAGDFLTSVDAGPLFGELLAVQLAEMWRILAGDLGSGIGDQRAGITAPFDLVEAGAGDGRLARDILEWAAASEPAFYASLRLHLVERSAAARAEHPRTLGPHVAKLQSSSDTLPAGVCGVILANELLDALPTHLVTMTVEGLREVYVAVDGNRLVEQTGRLSTPDLARYLDRAGAALQPGWRAEVNLAAVEWVHDAARRLRRGFLLLIDYGHPAEQLYSEARASGTLVTFTRHTSPPQAAGDGAPPPWLDDPGSNDITAHVDLTSVGAAAADAGLTTVGIVDQTYFLLGLGLADRLAESAGASRQDLERRLALKTLVLPGGLGSTHKVMIFASGVGSPRLRGLSAGARLT